MTPRKRNSGITAAKFCQRHWLSAITYTGPTYVSELGVHLVRLRLFARAQICTSDIFVREEHRGFW